MHGNRQYRKIPLFIRPQIGWALCSRANDDLGQNGDGFGIFAVETHQQFISNARDIVGYGTLHHAEDFTKPVLIDPDRELCTSPPQLRFKYTPSTKT